MVVQHPIFESGLMVVQDGKDFKSVNILEDLNSLNNIQTQYEKRIRNTDSLNTIFYMIRKSYRLTFLKFTKQYLSRKDFSRLLSSAWINSENPNSDINVSLKTLISWYKYADKITLMNEKEYNFYLSLPDSFMIYRGISKSGKTKGLSQTIDLEKAKWFANRFNRNGCVKTAIVNKKNVLAYFNSRDENEVVIDFYKLEKIENYKE